MGRRHRGGVPEGEAHPAGVGLVRHRRVRGLEYDGVAHRFGGRHRLLAGGRLPGRGGGDAVVGEQRHRLGRSEGAGRQPRSPAPPAALVDRDRGGRHRTSGHQVREGEQAGAGALQHRDALGTQPAGRLLVDRGGQVGQHHDRLVGAVQQRLRRPRERVVTVVLGHQVHCERDHPDRGVVRERGEAVGEQLLGLRAGAPHVQGVGRQQPLVEQVGQLLLGAGGQLRQLHAEPARGVGHQHPLGTGVVHRGQGAGRRSAQPPPDRERLQGIGHLVEVGHPVHAVGREHRLPGRVVAGQRAGVRIDQRPARRRAPDGQGHHRDVPGGRAGQTLAQQRDVAHGLHEQPDHPGLGPVERVGQVVRGGGHQLLPGGDDERVLQPAVSAQQGGEHRPGVGHHRDRTARERLPLQVPDGADPTGRVDEAHAPGPAQRHRSGGRDQLRAEPVRAAEHHRTGVVACGGQRQLPGQCPVRHPEQHQVHRLRQLRQRGRAAVPEHLAVPRVHQVHARAGRAAQHLGGESQPEGVGPLAGTHYGHRPRLQHPGQPRPVRRHPGGRRGARAQPFRAASHVRGDQREVRASCSAARAACMPGMPHTPPPAWVAELA